MQNRLSIMLIIL